MSTIKRWEASTGSTKTSRRTESASARRSSGLPRSPGCSERPCRTRGSHHPGIPQLDFIREIVRVLLANTVKPSTGRPSNPSRIEVIGAIRFDEVGHYVTKREKQATCNLETCKRRPVTARIKCKVTICVECFVAYHTKSVQERLHFEELSRGIYSTGIVFYAIERIQIVHFLNLVPIIQPIR